MSEFQTQSRENLNHNFDLEQPPSYESDHPPYYNKATTPILPNNEIYHTNRTAPRNYKATYQLHFKWSFRASPFQECVQPPRHLRKQFEALAETWYTKGQENLILRGLFVVASIVLLVLGAIFLKSIGLILAICGLVSVLIYFLWVYAARSNACAAVEEQIRKLNAENGASVGTWSEIRYEYTYKRTQYFIDLTWSE